MVLTVYMRKVDSVQEAEHFSSETPQRSEITERKETGGQGDGWWLDTYLVPVQSRALPPEMSLAHPRSQQPSEG